jgi:hypothetical protein
MSRPHCTCAPAHRPPCAWCIARMARSEAIADALLAHLRQDFPGDDADDDPRRTIPEEDA